MQLGNFYFDRRTVLSSHHVHPAFNHRVLCAAQVQVVLVDESIWHCNERDFTSKSTIVPPVSFKSGNIVFVTRVIHRRYYKIRAVMHGCRDVAVKGCVTAFMLTDLLSVDPEPAAVVSGANMQKGTS